MSQPGIYKVEQALLHLKGVTILTVWTNLEFQDSVTIGKWLSVIKRSRCLYSGIEDVGDMYKDPGRCSRKHHEKRTLSFFSFFLLLDILLIYISNVIPFPGLPSGTSYPISTPPAAMRVLLNPLPPSCSGIPQQWGIQPPQVQWAILPLLFNRAILCHTCGWNHGSLHVYSLVGDPVPGALRYMAG